MRRTIFAFLVVLGVLALGVRFFVNERLTSESPPGVEIQLVEYDSFNQLSIANSPLTQMQALVDRLSEAALNEEWNTASRVLPQLDDAWSSLRPERTSQLKTEKDIDLSIQALHRGVWGQDQQAVLSTAQKLTMLLGQLSN